MKGRIIVLALALILATATATRAEIIDRVLAVVGDQIVTLSDVRTALNLAFVPPDVSADPVAAALQRLIDRRLMLAEVERYAPAEPSPAAIDAAVRDLQARFESPAAFETARRGTAMSSDDLRRYVRDNLRIDAYLQQRFTPLGDPSEQDLTTYYRDHPEAFTRGGVLRPYAEVRGQVASLVVAERRDALVRDWLEGLRRRSSPVVLYLPAR